MTEPHRGPGDWKIVKMARSQSAHRGEGGWGRASREDFSVAARGNVLLGLERVLRRCSVREGEQRGGQDCFYAIQSGIRANVHTDPPGCTFPAVSLFAEVPPPRPDSTVTYWRPLWV